MTGRRALGYAGLAAIAIAQAVVPIPATPARAQTRDETRNETGEQPAPPTTPRDAGARYGQALGAAEVCYGAKITAKADALSKSYAGPDQDIFKATAAKIFNAWLSVKRCVNPNDPNTCKVIMDKSCMQAEAEIGANGSAVPGLVEFIAH